MRYSLISGWHPDLAVSHLDSEKLDDFMFGIKVWPL